MAFITRAAVANRNRKTKQGLSTRRTIERSEGGCTPLSTEARCSRKLRGSPCSGESLQARILARLKIPNCVADQATKSAPTSSVRLVSGNHRRGQGGTPVGAKADMSNHAGIPADAGLD